MEKKFITPPHQMGPYPPMIVAAMLSFFPLLGVGLLIATIWLIAYHLSNEAFDIIYFACILFFIGGAGIFFICLGWCFLSKGLAQYRFKNSGLIAKYPLRDEIIIPWEEFQQICICYAAYTTAGPRRANTVICFVKKGEHKNGNGRWKTDNPFRYRSVICIDYNPALEVGLREKCPYAVEDLRQSRIYRLK